MTYTETEIEEALRIARQVRDSILFGKSSLETSFHGFYTVSQILGRKEDLEWARKEINGYHRSEQDYPYYRRKLFRRFFRGNNSQIGELVNDDDLSYHSCYQSISEIEHEMNLPDKERQQIILYEVDLQKLKANHPTISASMISGWHFPKEQYTKVISGVKLEIIHRLNNMIGEITYGKIPQGIFKKFQTKVNDKLASTNPQAVSELNIAFESLGKSEDPERIAHVAFACRRLVQAVADKLYPAQNGQKYKMKDETEREIGEQHFLNRLEAYVDSIDSPNRKYLIREIKLLRDLLNEIPESANKGVHLNITNSGAERLVLYSYMILGDIIMEES